MPEAQAASSAPAAPASSATSAAPATQPAPAATSTAAPAASPAVATAPPAPKPPEKTQTPEQKADQDRRAAILANAKRVEASNRKAAEAVKAERAQFAQEQTAWRQQQAEILRKAEDNDRYGKILKEDPLKFLEAVGVSQQTILERMVKGDTRTPEEIAEAVVEKRFAAAKVQQEQEHVANEAKRKTQQAEVEAQVASKINGELKALLQKEVEKYEFCSQRPDAADLAWKLMNKHYNETAAKGRAEIMPLAEALDKVEEALEFDFQRFQSTSKKLAAKLAIAEAEKGKAKAEAVAVEAAKAARSRFYTEASQRQASSTPAATAEPQRNPHKLSTRRQLAADIQAELIKFREQQ